MLKHFFCLHFLTAICLCVCQTDCQSQQQKADNFAERKAALETRRDRAAYDSLHIMLVEHYTRLSAAERKILRETLQKHAVWPFENLCSDSEPGTRITLKGRVTDEKQQPVPGARLHIFHTDHLGYYSPLDSASGQMLEHDPRLDGFLTTDSLGRYEIRSIRPASYPIKYEGRLLPQHIHVMVEAEGFREGAFQIVFENDPAMTPHWVDWAKKRSHPIVKLTYAESGAQGEADLVLRR